MHIQVAEVPFDAIAPFASVREIAAAVALIAEGMTAPIPRFRQVGVTAPATLTPPRGCYD